MLDRAQVLSQVLGSGSKPVERLVAWLNDGARNVVERASAASFLGQARGEAAARAALLAHRKDPHPLVRFYVTEALGQLRPVARDALTEALTDPLRTIRMSAYGALAHVDPRLRDDPAHAKVRAAYEHRRDVILADDPRHLVDQALGLLVQKRADEAEALLRRAVAISDPVPDHRVKLVRVLLHQGKLDEVQRQLDALAKAAPNGQATRFTRAFLHLYRGQPAEFLRIAEPLAREGYETKSLLGAAAHARRQLGMPP